MLDKGSEWRKWDLHVHTPESFSHNYRFVTLEEDHQYDGDIWEKYISEMEKLSDIAVIGVTDYYTIDGYRKILNHKVKNRLGNISLFLPNIEFRLDQFLAGDTDRKLNFHVIFSNEINLDIIEREFLQELHIKTHLGEVRTLNRYNIEEIGRTLREHHPAFRDRSDYFIGCINITVSFSGISQVLKDKGSLFGGKYLFILPHERWDDIEWDGQDHLTRKQLFVKSHALFSSNPNTIEWALGKREVSRERFLEEFCSLKPCIHGSDAHEFDRLCKPDQNRFCWIKADPTFEGLKQICYEPEDRVRIQEHSPEPRKNIYTIDNLKISNSIVSGDLEIIEQEIPINSNLIAVIGGKGSGKTAFLDMLANCFEDRCMRSGVDQNSFIQRIEDQKPDLAVSISFLGGENFSKEISDNVFFSTSQITHLPQGKIEEYSSDKAQLHKKISEIILSNREVIESGFKEQMEQSYGGISFLIKTIKELNRHILDLESETVDEIVNNLNSENMLYEGKLKNKNQELKELVADIGEGSKERVERLKGNEGDLLLQHGKMGEARRKLTDVQTRIEALFSLNRDIDNLNRYLGELGVPEAIVPFNVQSRIEAASSIAGYIQRELNAIITKIGEVNQEVGKLSGLEKSHAELLKEIAEIASSIQSIGKELEEVVEKKKQISDYEDQRSKAYINLIVRYFYLKSTYDRIIERFSSGKDTILDNIDFQSSILFDRERFQSIAEEIFDLRKTSGETISSLANSLQRILSGYLKKDNLIETFITACLHFRNLLKQSRSISDFYAWLFDNYFSLSTEIYFSGIHMDKLSIGQKGTVLLKILLSEGDHPLIIDQPEENLDNKFIYEFLVDAFKKAKEKRQIIIATHNANLVVNTDAEQIVIAEFQENKISYKSGAIENETIRNGITTLLEGGEEAFKKREAKYGYAN